MYKSNFYFIAVVMEILYLLWGNYNVVSNLVNNWILEVHEVIISSYIRKSINFI